MMAAFILLVLGDLDAAERRIAKLLPAVEMLLLLPVEELLCGSFVLGELARFLPRIVCMIIVIRSDNVSYCNCRYEARHSTSLGMDFKF